MLSYSMVTELQTQTPFSLEDLRQNFERLQSDLNIVQNELDQALGVWRTILTTEKQEFKKLIEDHQKAWDRDDQNWQKDRQAYEQKIKELEEIFNKQLTATEQNAVRALNELDSAWQQERSRWQQTLTQQTRETRQRDDLQNASQQQLRQRVAQLEEENAALQSQVAQSENQEGYQQQALRSQIVSLESQLAAWEQEKSAWQQQFSEQMRQVQQTESDWASDRQQNDAIIQSLQQDVVTLQAQLNDSEAARTAQQQQLTTYIDSLEKQVSELNDFIHQLLPPPHPFRRKSDQPAGQTGRPLGPTGQFNPSSPRASY